MTIWCMRFACWISKATNTHTHTHTHTHKLCNTHCFYTATLVERKRLNATSYENCLSCFILRRTSKIHDYARHCNGNRKILFLQIFRVIIIFIPALQAGFFVRFNTYRWACPYCCLFWNIVEITAQYTATWWMNWSLWSSVAYENKLWIWTCVS